MSEIDFSKYLEYNPETGIFVHRVSRGVAKKGAVAGHPNSQGHLRVKIEGRYIFLHRIAFYMEYGECPDQIDHINGDPSDNRMANLRPCGYGQNAMNRGVQSNNTSGYKGVSFHKASGLWNSYVNCDGKRVSLGYYKTPEKAGAVSDAKRREFHGEFYHPPRVELDSVRLPEEQS